MRFRVAHSDTSRDALFAFDHGAPNRDDLRAGRGLTHDSLQMDSCVDLARTSAHGSPHMVSSLLESLADDRFRRTKNLEVPRAEWQKLRRFLDLSFNYGVS